MLNTLKYKSIGLVDLYINIKKYWLRVQQSNTLMDISNIHKIHGYKGNPPHTLVNFSICFTSYMMPKKSCHFLPTNVGTQI
jgi:hypothetical protein